MGGFLASCPCAKPTDTTNQKKQRKQQFLLLKTVFIIEKHRY
ncbi:hypothetical protein RCH33_1240 [Flavobacterium daejeonense]|nr:hypothetical protein RCH33_1240 [Flavobacterium daejeonense]